MAQTHKIVCFVLSIYVVLPLFVKYFRSHCGRGLMGLVLALWLSVSACLVFLLVTLVICLNMFRWTGETLSSAQLSCRLTCHQHTH